MLKKYDVLFIFPDRLNADGVKEVQERIRKDVESFGGIVGSVDEMGKRPFARPMKKREAGYYARMKLEMDPGKINAFKDRYALVDDVFRVQVVLDEPIVQKESRRKPDGIS